MNCAKTFHLIASFMVVKIQETVIKNASNINMLSGPAFFLNEDALFHSYNLI